MKRKDQVAQWQFFILLLSRHGKEGGVVIMVAVYVIRITLDSVDLLLVYRVDYTSTYIIILHITYIPTAPELYSGQGQIFIGQDAPPSNTTPLKPIASTIT
jgi:hypothetical protein